MEDPGNYEESQRQEKSYGDWFGDKRAPVLAWMEDWSRSPSLHYLLHAGGGFL